MQDGRDACSERAVERARHVLAPLDPLPVRPERPCKGREVRVDEVRAAHAARVVPLLVHANRPVHAVVDDEDDDRRAVLPGGGELRHAHQEVAVTRDAHDVAVRVNELRRDRRRQAVPHRAREGRELGAVAPEGVEAVGPHGEVAGATRDDRVRPEPLAQDGHDVGHLDGAGQRPPCERLEVGGVRSVHVLSAPLERVERRRVRPRSAGPTRRSPASARRRGPARSGPGGRGSACARPRAAGWSRSPTSRCRRAARPRRAARRRRGAGLPGRDPGRCSGGRRSSGTRCRRSPGSARRRRRARRSPRASARAAFRPRPSTADRRRSRAVAPPSRAAAGARRARARPATPAPGT